MKRNRKISLVPYWVSVRPKREEYRRDLYGSHDSLDVLEDRNFLQKVEDKLLEFNSEKTYISSRGEYRRTLYTQKVEKSKDNTTLEAILQNCFKSFLINTATNGIM